MLAVTPRVEKFPPEELSVIGSSAPKVREGTSEITTLITLMFPRTIGELVPE